jgi:hypothetical protein
MGSLTPLRLVNARTISKVVLGLFFVFLLIFPGTSRAQGVVGLDALNIALWPEYDRPEMLVIYKLVWAPSVTFPLEVSFPIPAAAGEPNAVAERAVGGELFNMAYQREVRGDWAVIRFTATMPEAQLEYYDPGIVKDGGARQYTYQWPGDYSVNALSVQVQQPAGSDDFRMNPDLGSPVQGTDTLNYYAADLGSLAVDESFDLTLRYTKSSDALSVELVELLQVQPAGPIDLETAGRVDITGSLSNMLVPLLLGSLGVVLIAGSGFWFWRSSRRAARSAARTRRRRRVSSAVIDTADEGAGVFCHQCGKRAAPSDRFCRACGTRLRAS